MLADGWNRGFLELNWLGELVIWINWGGAVAAVVMNTAAARVCRDRSRVLFSAILGLSIVYTVSYLVLLFGPFSLRDWSLAMRLVSITVWPLVWCGPAALKYYRAQAEPHITGEILKVVVEKLESEATT